MKHCKKFSGPIFSQNCPPLNPTPSHGSLQQNSSPKVLLPSFPNPPPLTDFRWEERGTEDRGIISRFFSQSYVTRFFFRFIGSLCDLKVAIRLPFPLPVGFGLWAFFIISHRFSSLYAWEIIDSLLNVDLAFTFTSCYYMTLKQSDFEIVIAKCYVLLSS